MPLRDHLPDGRLRDSDIDRQALARRHLQVADPTAGAFYKYPVQQLPASIYGVITPDLTQHPTCRSCPNEAACLLDPDTRCGISWAVAHSVANPHARPGDRQRFFHVTMTLEACPGCHSTPHVRHGSQTAFTYLEMADALEEHMRTRSQRK